MSGLPFNGVVRSAEDLSDAVATGIADRDYYIAGVDELQYLWPEAKRASTRFQLLQAFAAGNGWHVTPREGLKSALFQVLPQNAANRGN